MATKNRSNELRITRIYDAPVPLVWNAWTDPKQVAQWWGPRGFTITTHNKEFKPGGIWHYTMHGPDGVDYENKTIYLEIEEHSKLVYDHGGNDNQPPLFRVTVRFSELRQKTKMELCMTLPSPEAAEETERFIKEAGGNATWDRLAEFLEKESSGKEKFVINRTFDASIELMFEMWTNPKHFSRWLAPTGSTMAFIRSEIAPGRTTFYSMTGAEGVKMFGRATYLNINAPHFISYTQQFCDADEKISRHPFAPTWPETMLTTVSFDKEGPARTRVTVTWEPDSSATDEEIRTFITSRGGMTQGWSGSFDKLERYLAEC